MTSLSVIREYYRRIDVGDLDWVVGLFDQNASYSRADAVYVGRMSIDGFFRGQRKIKGSHQIDRIIQATTGETVVALGCFHGTGNQGDRRDVGFNDVWTFNKAKLVTRRQTFLALGSAYVRE
jgi:ketosteroid isomerase-like protein